MNIWVAVLGFCSLSFFISYVKASIRLKKISEAFASLLVIVNDQPNKFADEKDYDVHRENFIKFLSDSREWAYAYIEDVQAGLKSFINQVQPEIDYYNKYGIVIDGMIPPHDKALKKISEELEQLKKLLPEEIDDRR